MTGCSLEGVQEAGTRAASIRKVLVLAGGGGVVAGAVGAGLHF